MRRLLMVTACLLTTFAVLADDPALSMDNVPLRPFPSKHQVRGVVDRLIVADGPGWIPKGGVCLENSRCQCSEIEVNGICGSNWWSCVSSTQGQYCRYLCHTPNECENATAETCAEANPCS